MTHANSNFYDAIIAGISSSQNHWSTGTLSNTYVASIADAIYNGIQTPDLISTNLDAESELLQSIVAGLFSVNPLIPSSSYSSIASAIGDFFHQVKSTLEPAGGGGGGGFQGNQGRQGFQGGASVPGVQGYQGNIGDVGVQGNQGNVGSTGTQGNQGNQGNIGVQGNQGNQGNVGSTGTQGNQGNVGSTGVQGNQGNVGGTGVQGNQGNQGSSGIGSQGNQGNQGVLGVQGFQGGASVPGVQGYQGVVGPQGASGTGAQGNQGNVGGTGTQGNQGNTGTGTQGNQGLVGTGAQGYQGVQGLIGSQGVQGYQGANSLLVTDPTTGNSPIILIQGNGNLNDSSGNSYNITVATGSATYMSLVPGATPYGLEVNGSTPWYYRNSRTAALDLIGDMTIEFLLNVQYCPVSGGNSWILSYGATYDGTANTNMLYGIFLYAVGVSPPLLWFYQAHGANVNATYVATRHIPLCTTMHVAYVRTGTTLKYYINGVVQDTFTSIALPTIGASPVQVLKLGANYAGSPGSPGASFIIGGVQVIGSALSDAQVLADAKAQLSWL